ncbi:hypothetical protein D3C76_1882310 [compost metagenome]
MTVFQGPRVVFLWDVGTMPLFLDTVSQGEGSPQGMMLVGSSASVAILSILADCERVQAIST